MEVGSYHGGNCYIIVSSQIASYSCPYPHAQHGRDERTRDKSPADCQDSPSLINIAIGRGSKGLLLHVHQGYLPSSTVVGAYKFQSECFSCTALSQSSCKVEWEEWECHVFVNAAHMAHRGLANAKCMDRFSTRCPCRLLRK